MLLPAKEAQGEAPSPVWRVMEGCLEEVVHKLRPEGQGGISLVKTSGGQVSVRPGGKGEGMAVQRAKDSSRAAGTERNEPGKTSRNQIMDRERPSQPHFPLDLRGCHLEPGDSQICSSGCEVENVSERGQIVAEGSVDPGDRWCWQGVVTVEKERNTRI